MDTRNHPELNAPLHCPSNQQRNTMNDQTGMNRRTFLTRAAAAAALASTSPSNQYVQAPRKPNSMQ
jgi:hypothetical protein